MDIEELLEAIPPRLEWDSGVPPERPVVAMFAAISAEVLCRGLSAFLLSKTRRLHGAAPEVLRAAQEMLEGESIRTEDLRSIDFDFAGGSHLEEALQSIESSLRLRRVTLRSLADALNAAGMIVGMARDNEDWHANPARWVQDESARETEDLERLVRLSGERRSRPEVKERTATLWEELLQFVAKTAAEARGP
jgi:hypothetical protein